jgi:pyruvate-ferredoxin/flavodoxin oxidoreductase
MHTSPTRWATMDGNDAAARVAHALSEVIALYPITPSSAMGESADAWSAAGRTNIWGAVPEVVEMQSEAGAAGALHGVVTKGVLGATFTASQGLLLMLPNMYKIAGELTPAVIHVAARTLATHALSIFGDHQDVMSARMTGWLMLASSSVQEAQDLAMVSHAATLRSRIPAMHFFDGFRTSHEVNKIQLLSNEDMRSLIREEDVVAHRQRGLTPDAPTVRGTAQNPDTFFQAREACNVFYDAAPAIVAECMAELAELTGREYHLVDYYGAPDADRVVIMMGSGFGTTRETVDALNAAGEKVGVLAVRLYRPFPTEALLEALPASVRSIAVLDRTKEPGATADPLFQDVLVALSENPGRFEFMPRLIAGRYGLSSKEYSPAMAKAVFDELKSDSPKKRFTVGIVDDVTHLSLDYDPDFRPDAESLTAVFYGLGSDGTVGASKNSVKIIAEDDGRYAQGYFVYDSRKSGATTVSHLRFGSKPIDAAYLIDEADFVAVHQFEMLGQMRTVDIAKKGAKVLINSPFSAAETWENLPVEVQQVIIDKGLKLYVINALDVAHKAGLGKRINTVMQPCFFYLSGVVPQEDAIPRIKASVEKSYGSKRGRTVVERNWAAIDASIDALEEVQIPAGVAGDMHRMPPLPDAAPDFVQQVTATMLRGEGDLLPVSALPVDGTWPTGTSKFEKRGIADQIPIWDPSLCIDCGKCAITCPHTAIRIKVSCRPTPWKRPPRPCSRRSTTTAASRTTSSSSRSPRTTAPAVACASTCARPAARPRSSTSPSTCATGASTSRWSGTTSTSSSTSQRSTAPRSGWTRSRASASCSRSSNTAWPARAVARRATSRR